MDKIEPLLIHKFNEIILEKYQLANPPCTREDTCSVACPWFDKPVSPFCTEVTEV